MGDMIDRDAAIGALEDRRDKYLKDSQTWQQIQLDILAIRALPAAPAEDVRAMALREAAAVASRYNVNRGQGSATARAIASAIYALIDKP
jgi:hypothetical protein